MLTAIRDIWTIFDPGGLPGGGTNPGGEIINLARTGLSGRESESAAERTPGSDATRRRTSEKNASFCSGFG